MSPQLVVILVAPVLAGAILAAPVLAIVSMAATIVAKTEPALAGSPAAGLTPAAVLCSGYSACSRHGYDSYGYGPRQDRSFWRMPAGDQGTNYVAYVESTFFLAPTPGYLLGNAGQWPRSAAAHGVSVNNVPSAGAVAAWGGQPSGAGRAGHVAVVERVGPRDRYIIVSQQRVSGAADGYDWTRVNAGTPRTGWPSWPDRFIHFPVRR